MQKPFPNKMISNDDLSDFHFAGTGSNLPPMNIRAKSQAEAEAIWRKKNDDAAKKQPHTL